MQSGTTLGRTRYQTRWKLYPRSRCRAMRPATYYTFFGMRALIAAKRIGPRKTSLGECRQPVVRWRQPTKFRIDLLREPLGAAS